MLEDLKQAVLAANLELPSTGLVKLTWGNVSGRDPKTGLMVIKASGASYQTMTTGDMVVVDEDGRVVEGDRRPSTDTPTHLVLYRGLDRIGGIVHTHSTWASSWAQAQRPLPVLGTTHADMCSGPVPVTVTLTPEQVGSGYEEATGRAILNAMEGRPASDLPAVLVGGHGPFCWGATAAKAVEAAVTLEEVAKMAWLSTVLEPKLAALAPHIAERHYTRKHGPDAYYGQAGQS